MVIIMDKKRAEVIVSSPNMVNVTYQGTPIYIEKVNQDNTAIVHVLNEVRNSEKVDISSLIEQYE